MEKNTDPTSLAAFLQPLGQEEMAARLQFIHEFAKNVPHAQALQFSLVSCEFARGTLRLPYQPAIVGDPQTGVIHGGAITTLLDACCGIAVFMALPRLQPIATLDLRIDYFRAAAPGEPVFAAAHCYKITHHIAFVRALAYEHLESDPVAHATGTFMLDTKAGDFV